MKERHFFIFDHKNRELWSIRADDVDGVIRIPMWHGFVGHCATHCETIRSDDPTQDKRWYGDGDFGDFKTNSILCSPVMNSNGSCIAVLELLNKKGGPFDEEDEKLITMLADHVRIFIEQL